LQLNVGGGAAVDDFAKLLTAIAPILGAIAWPVTLLTLALLFREALQTALSRIPFLLDRVTKASVAGVKVELERVADAESGDKSGKVTPKQKETATRIAVEKQDVGSQPLLGLLDRLCLEYDALRRVLQPSEFRTRAMTRMVAQMRSLAPSLIEFLDAYKSSGSAGSRLAAITMMQMVPTSADVEWLEGRFSSDQPFLFYHAALALQNVADSRDTIEGKLEIREVAQRALKTVKSFAGVPDRHTMEVLETLIASLNQIAHEHR
jgi:hypothetical protein